MKKILLIMLIVVSCSKSDDSVDNEGKNPIIGDWTIIESGGAYGTGETFKESMPCSNAQKLHFFENYTFELEIWWDTVNGCEFDRIQYGSWVEYNNTSFPDSNYRLVYNEIPGYADGSTGYPIITFSGNTMKVLYDTDGYFDYTYRLYVKE